ncbi:hypothetical protein [Flavobacterium defluvii]|uniref:Uncharacterized protein n=1 Tax=Flavobacterium defluvii TaxID=370979 RepID=A0A1M5E6A8_9FLAO|nr:hypothetical protein [Flavobacterium defluvii]SHF74581.1 hypothetical protein SAMN05443663_10137 [Flavobacterium defluvii]
MYYIILCEIATGIVLELDGKTRFVETDADNLPHISFENLKKAEERADMLVLENQDLEIAIYDENWKFIKRVTKKRDSV